ncbi:MAG: Oxidoreductase domain protein [Chthoniobacteraceae bacterium]|nr:Oxidoreductase domain protein [Chthoniobacteraceae bacterium]
MINVGIVGLGFMAAAHLKAYKQVPEARIVALCNPSGRHLDGDFTKVAGNLDTGDPLRLDMSSIAAYRSYEEMLANPEIDLIDICAPTSTHPTLVIDALRAGKHVICEKPLARTSLLAAKIAREAAGAAGFFMPAMCLRFWPEFVWLKERVEQGSYGRVLSAGFRRVAEPPAWGQSHFHNGALSGGALLDLHIHDTDFIQYCFGKPDRVYSSGYSRFSQAIDHVVTHYHFDSPVIVHAEGSWTMSPGFGFSMSYFANFERATVDFNSSRGLEALRVYESGLPLKTITLGQPDGYVRELAYFLECIRLGERPTIVTAEDALHSIEICEAEEESVLTGKVVSVTHSNPA